MTQAVPTPADVTRSPAPVARLWVEFVLLFAAVPVALTVFQGQYRLFPALLAFTALAMGLLALTPGVRARELLRGPVLSQWPLILGVAIASAALSTALVFALVPGRFLDLPTNRPGLWLAIMLLYPVLSAIPQELVYRALFFRRYGGLFPDARLALAANAAAFAMAHAFYQNPVAILSTLAAGLVFGWAYQRHGSFLLVAVLHAIAGMIMFTSGLGVYFYHGAIGHLP